MIDVYTGGVKRLLILKCFAGSSGVEPIPIIKFNLPTVVMSSPMARPIERAGNEML